MTESTSYDLDDNLRDALEEAQQAIAEGIAALSTAQVVPENVSLSDQVWEAADVDFSTPTWLEALVDVQGWLNFPNDIMLETPQACLEAVAQELGMEIEGALIVGGGGEAEASPALLDALASRIEIATKLQNSFIATWESCDDVRQASDAWRDEWSEEEESIEYAEPVSITASSKQFRINEIIGRNLNLSPTYQRGDVWSNADRQALIESVLRGIPLPSIILLQKGVRDPWEVVDGKQRLTALLRFIGAHPIAVKKVQEVAEKHQGNEDLAHVNLVNLLQTDYPKFRRVWRKLEGELLNTSLEDQYYFPFKLRPAQRSSLQKSKLERLCGKYYTQIMDEEVVVAGKPTLLHDIFDGVSEYELPAILYTEATPRQIHEVFRLYNKQGVHLNAEEIRNAIYHEVGLARAILAAAGDINSDVDPREVVPWIDSVPRFAEIAENLNDYNFGNKRYRRTKVLSWLVSALLHDAKGKAITSTAGNIDQLFEKVLTDHKSPLRNDAVLADLFVFLSEAIGVHAEMSDILWSPEFRNSSGKPRWQELQLVGSLLGICLAKAAAGDEFDEVLDEHGHELYVASRERWQRPSKTQTRTQWDFIARVSKEVVETLGFDPEYGASVIADRFGSSGYVSLQAMRLHGK